MGLAGRVDTSGSDWLEGPDLVRARTDHTGRGLGDFVPRAREITERFGDHQPGFLAQTPQDLYVGVQLA